MQTFYRVILCLYPAEYRAAFASEMTETFAHARMAAERQGLLSLTLFAACEFTGLCKELLAQRMAKLVSQGTYMSAGCGPRRHGNVPAEIADVQHHLEHLIRSMEFAIAHHDFPKARFYSNEERISRALLQRLVSEQKPSGTLVLSAEFRSSNEYA